MELAPHLPEQHRAWAWERAGAEGWGATQGIAQAEAELVEWALNGRLYCRYFF